MAGTTGAALIGTGMVARTHVAAFADQSAAELVAVVGRTTDKAQDFTRDVCGGWSSVPDAQTLDAVCGDPAIAMAVVTTPPSERAEIVAALTAAGKAILLEKPVERDLSRARAIVETCERAGVPLGVVFQHRMRAAARHLAELVADGALGPLRMVDVRVPWWRDQSYYDAPGRGTYARDGGGVLLTQAIHTLDLMLSLTGPPATVRAMTATTGAHQMEAEDFAVAGLVFPAGAVGSVMATTAAFPGGGETMALHFANGSARLDAGQVVVDWRDGRRDAWGEPAASGGGADPMAFTHEWHRDVLTDFAAALQGARSPLVTGREALRVHALIAAIEASARDGRDAQVEETDR